jgi:copper resistance protein B
MTGASTFLVSVLTLTSPLVSQAQTPEAPHQQGSPQAPDSPSTSTEVHSAHQTSAPAPPPPFIPPVTDADREAAFPDVHGHTVHDRAVNYFVLFDQFEGQTGDGASGFSWDTKGWVGRDRNRLWFRAEGDHVGGDLAQAQTNVLYGRSFSPWWDLTAGMRFDTLPDTPRSALAIGVQGLTPYRFAVEASAFVEFSGRTHVRIETEYDLLITNRLALQPLVEFEIYGRDDLERGIAAGLSTGELGLRLRYEFRREVAPYIGFVWTGKFFGTGDYAEAAGQRTRAARLALGVRWWL